MIFLSRSMETCQSASLLDDCLGCAVGQRDTRQNFGFITAAVRECGLSGVMAFHCGAAAGKLLFAGLMIVRLGIVPSGEGFGEEIWGGEACR